MKFGIGDRVRIVAPGNLHGKTGTIYEIDTPRRWRWPWQDAGMGWSQDALAHGVHAHETAYLIDVDGLGRYCRPMSMSFDRIGIPAYWLRRLEDPKADEFIERIKKLAREPAPLTQPERDKIIADDRRADLRDSLVTGAASK